MKELIQITKLTFKHKGSAFLVILFNMLFVIFNLLSLVLFIPFLNLIFSEEKPDINLHFKPCYNGDFFDFASNYYDYILNGFIHTAGEKNALLFVCLSVLIAFVFKNVFRYCAVYTQSYIRIAIVRDLRLRAFGKIMKLPISYFNDEKKGDLITRMTSDMNEVENASVAVLELLFREPIAIAITLSYLFYTSTSLTLFALVLLPVSAFIISRIGKSLKRTANLGQIKMGDLLSNFDEAITGIRIIKSFIAEKMTIKKFSAINTEQQRLATKTFRKKDLSSPLNETLGAVVMIAIVWYGGSLILDKSGDMSGQAFIGFIVIFSQLLRPIQGVATGIGNLNKGSVSLDRINQILNTDEKINNPINPINLEEFQKSIEFKNVQFSYGEEQVLTDLSFSINKGETIALVGESGSGKSTIADLIPRFYDIHEGSIEIDGVNIKDFEISKLRAIIGMVSQESILFNDTIHNNIAFSNPNASKDEVEEAARIANAHTFITEFPERYESNVGERGNKLSGGQKQRVSIARAVLKNPPIMILDEATSALDTESEKLVQEALNNLMKDRTSLVIAHRLSTIQHADKIIVLSKGRIVEVGTHDSLLAKDGHYAKYHNIQSS
jgi:subfamily B ATP-binding cassette protein MsbA